MSIGTARPDRPTEVRDSGGHETGSDRRVKFTLAPIVGHGIPSALSVAICALILVPIGTMIARTFYDGESITLSIVTETLLAPGLGPVILNTLIAVGASGVLATAVGGLFAWLNERTDARIAYLGDVMPMVPLLVPAIAVAIGWVFLLAPSSGFLNVGLRSVLNSAGMEISRGPLNIYSWPGLIAVYTYTLVPYVYIVIAAGLRNMDASLEEASKVCGRGAIKTFFKVTLPCVKPSLATSTFLVTATGLSLFATPVVIGSGANIEVLSVRIVRLVGFSYPAQMDAAITLGSLILGAIALTWFWQSRVLAKGRFATIGGKGSGGTPTRLGRWKYVAWSGMFIYLVFLSVLPMIALVVVSLQPFWSTSLSNLSFDAYRTVFLENSFTQRALRNSMVLGIATATVAMFFGAMVQWTVKHWPRGWNKALDGISKLPAGVSHLTVALGFILVFAGPPFRLAGTTIMLFGCYLVLYMPEASFISGTAMRQVGNELVEASYVSGSGRARTIRRVMLPLMKSGLAAGWTLIFLRVAAELTASAMLAGPHNPVIGFQILSLWENSLFPLLAALAAAMSVVSIIIVGAVLVATRRKGIPIRRG